MGVYRDRFCWAVGFFLPIEVRSFPGPQGRGTGGTLSVLFGASRPRPPANTWWSELLKGGEEFAGCLREGRSACTMEKYGCVRAAEMLRRYNRVGFQHRSEEGT